ncbi:cysteine desulfurase [bacterium BMS3Bbin10]|nr:cysteine desulfurase [bacterium BMS3Bbin10]
MVTLDMEFVERRFPALKTRDFVYFDNAGGSLVLEGVARRVQDYLTTSSVQHGASYPKSRIASQRLREAQESVACFVNARGPEEVIMGPSASALLRTLSTMLSGRFGPGDEIIVSQVEHEANIGAWLPLEKAGVNIRIWPIDKDTLELGTQTLAGLLTERTKLVCVNHVSNVLGTINPIREFADVAHEQGAKICVDAVAYAPHRLVDVQAFDADYYVFSFYKLYGPHHAALIAARDDLLELPGISHYFISEDDIPYKFQPGNVNFELSYGCIGICDYLIELAKHHSTAEVSEREYLAQAFNVIAAHEQKLSARLLDYLKSVPAVRIIGDESDDAGVRVPTISFVAEGQDSRAIVEHIDQFGIGIRYGDFYARRLIEALGLERHNGVVRVSMAHYNTLEEVDKLIGHLDPLLLRRVA